MEPKDLQIIQDAQAQVQQTLQIPCHAPLPNPQSPITAAASLQHYLPDQGRGLKATSEYLFNDIAPGLNGSSLSPTYYGFVTGGITPAARLADNLVTLFDQNLAVHLPNESVATVVEDCALCMLLELLNFQPQEWPARVFTTGATASNVLGLACGREFVVSSMLTRKGLQQRQGEGLLSACGRAGIEEFQVLTTLPHSSLGKAANIIGVGSAAIVDVTRAGHFLDFDMEKLEECLRRERTASIVVISCGEVNTGAFATNSMGEVKVLRELCDQYGAWLHVDGAFGIFARTLPQRPQYDVLHSGTAGLELADSIGGDGHKLLNVPYDCGFFFTRHRNIPERVFANTGAAYLASGSVDSLPSPLNMRLENSSRFRGLPVYASLVAYGRDGYAAMVVRMVELSRKIARWLDQESEHFDLLPRGWNDTEMERMYMCVLFRAKDDALNEVLTDRIKASGKVYASGTKWGGKPATRFAIAKWDVDVDRDFKVVREVLMSLV